MGRKDKEAGLGAGAAGRDVCSERDEVEAEEVELGGRSEKLEVFSRFIPLLSWCNCEGRNEQTRDVSW